ncbi:MAG: efflux RND transporter periplasmic adaptor subunit [Rhodospirillales bacterium]|nr:efflux RND transporter periplasmic adaptor subunit [Rhodospirillales bacterium]MBO6785202.1 efflux RND transporter periplasmic adaptor subunit [Rhodospirillales bacterium]
MDGKNLDSSVDGEPLSVEDPAKTAGKRGGGIKWAAIAALAGILLWGTHDQWGPLFANVDLGTGGGEKSAGAAKKKTPPKGVPVIVEAVGETRDSILIEAIGTARARLSVTLFPAAAGEIVAFPVETGQSVKKDDLILRLDARDAQLQVRVAETRVKEAENALARAQRLRDNNVRSRANVEDAEVILERTKLELGQAREALSDRTVRAPFDGIVGIPKVEAGDRVTTTTELITIDDRSTLLVEFEVAERNLSRLKLGMPVTARTPSFRDRDIDGTINKIDSRVDPVSRTVRVRAAFPNTDDSLRPGMSFFVNLDLPGEMLPSVPELALQWQNGESFIWRIVDGKAERITVSTKRRLNNKVLIEGDVKPGDVVVVEGVQRLRPGRVVEISASVGS